MSEIIPQTSRTFRVLEYLNRIPENCAGKLQESAPTTPYLLLLQGLNESKIQLTMFIGVS